MFARSVSSAARAVIKALAVERIFPKWGFYLAGGTGLALHLGHRFSEDLDFFSERVFEPEVLVRELGPRLSLTVFGITAGTLHASCGEAVKTSFFTTRTGAFTPKGSLMAVRWPIFGTSPP
ncbi:nucleotidyl transferase AbiEii/AbiGii toxin family protein [Thermodesulfitimonas sp.]